MEYRIPLDRIDDNPWQTRITLDEDHIQALADDIAKRGLLQKPIGRIVEADGRRTHWSNVRSDHFAGALLDSGRRVQLAFGHNRLAAFRRLDREDMAVEIRDLSDEAMADLAWTENAQRKDLNAIEEALAIQDRMESFGWTQAQVADHLDIGRSTVANKLRLLQLPDDVQEPLKAGQISERQAIAMLPAFNVPANIQQKMQNGHFDYYRLDGLIENAQSGRSSTKLRKQVEALINHWTNRLMNADFPLGELFAEHDGVRAAACADCPLTFDYAGDTRCPDSDCWDRKVELWTEQCMEAAVEETGLPAVSILRSWRDRTFFDVDEEEDVLAEIRDAGCDNLKLIATAADWAIGPNDQVAFVCAHPNANCCACRHNEESAVSAEEVARQRRHDAMKRNLNTQIVKPAADALAGAIADDSAGIWRVLVKILGADDEAVEGWGREKCKQHAGYLLVQAVMPPSWYHIEERQTGLSSALAAMFDDAGVELPWEPDDPPVLTEQDLIEKEEQPEEAAV